MEIVKANKRQLIEVLYIVREGAKQLMSKGVMHWHNTLIDYSQIEKDLDEGYVYILLKNKGAIGTITIKPAPDSEEVLEIGRLTIYPAFQGKGYARMLLVFVEQQAKERGINKLRSIIPLDDQSLRQLFEKKGYDTIDKIHHVPPELIQVVFEKGI